MIKNLPKIYYDFAIEDESKKPIIIPDTLVRIKHLITELENNNLFFYYTILDGETPEIVSHKFYETMDYHWTILYVNDRFDYITDFPMSDNDLLNFVKRKYGEDQVDAIHHYENAHGNITDEYYYDYKNRYGNQPSVPAPSSTMTWNSDLYKVAASPITNFEYEIIKNEKNRIIKVIKPSYISEFVKKYTKLMKDSTK